MENLSRARKQTRHAGTVIFIDFRAQSFRATKRKLQRQIIDLEPFPRTVIVLKVALLRGE